MNGTLQQLQEFITKRHFFDLIAALLILGVGSFLASRVRAAVERAAWLDSQRRLLLAKGSYYAILIGALTSALGQFGVDIKVILGAAGVLTVAVGFAAQTSASNLISGIFLMFEKPFTVGDIITIGDTTGEVLSIDLLSSKIRTFNNLMVRVPNETLVKTQIINQSYFPVRRVDFRFNFAMQSDLRAVEAILREAARQHPLSLEEPNPIFIMSGFSDSGMTVQFQVWTLPANLLAVQNDLYRDFKAAFERAGIRLVFPLQAAAPAPR